MELTQEKLTAYRVPMMAVAAGVGAALVTVTLPHVYLESIIGATGLSEIIPAAAPPLGNTARGLIAIMAGLVSASAIYFFLNRKGGSDMGVALREQINAASPIELDLEEEAKAKKSRFALPKFDTKSLTKFLKKPKKDKARVMDLSDLPQLRKLDDETDEPVRPSIFAAPEPTETLPETIQPFEEPAPEVEVEVESESAADITPPLDPIAADDLQPAEPAPVEPATISVAAPDIATAGIVVPTEDLSALNIAQLADRLEAGLQRLKQLEAINAEVNAMASQAAVVAEPAPAPALQAQPEHLAVVQPETEPAAAPFSEAKTFSPPPLKQVEKPAETTIENRQADMDVALKAALGTLEKMTAQR